MILLHPSSYDKKRSMNRFITSILSFTINGVFDMHQRRKVMKRTKNTTQVITKYIRTKSIEIEQKIR